MCDYAINKYARRLLAVVTVLLPVFLCSPLSAAPQSPFYLAQPAGMFRPPFIWRDKCSHKNIGSGIETIELIFQQHGLSMQAKVYTADRHYLSNARKDLIAGKLDGMEANSSVNEDLLVYAKTPRFALGHAIISVASKRLRLKSFEDLKGKKGAIITARGIANASSEFSAYWENHLSIDVVPNIEKSFEQLERGEYDYIIGGKYDLTRTINLLQRKDLFDKSQLSSRVYQPVYFGIAKNSPYLQYLDVIDKAIAEMRASGREEFIYRKYMDLWAKGLSKKCEE